ncbi:integrase core domain-containing protein [Micromonospora matsumotoense]|uniref:integrase core domain-containing protein n=1 Tax=Micromonospora matsumotoense TaxID=121616 RepID=UPI0033DF6D31
MRRNASTCQRRTGTGSGGTDTRAELVAAVDTWAWRYNHERRHSALGMLPPIRYEQSLTGTANAA